MDTLCYETATAVAKQRSSGPCAILFAFISLSRTWTHWNPLHFVNSLLSQSSRFQESMPLISVEYYVYLHQSYG
jgi:hypothetical protein